jgi:hypothetical protein
MNNLIKEKIMSDNTTNQTVVPGRKVAVAGMIVVPVPSASAIGTTTAPTINVTTTTGDAPALSVTVTAPTSEVAAIVSDVKADAQAVVTKAETITDDVVADIKTGIGDIEQDFSKVTSVISAGAVTLVDDVKQEASKVATVISSGSETFVTNVKADVSVATSVVETKATTTAATATSGVTAVEGYIAAVRQKLATATSAAESKVENMFDSAKAEVKALETKVVTAVENDYSQTVVDGEKLTAGLKQAYSEFVDAMTTQPIAAETPVSSGVVRVLFTKTKWSIPSMLVRWALPRSRFAWALSSHCLIDTGNGFLYEALPIHGVRKTPATVALDGLTIVDTVDFQVPDVAAATTFLETQLGAAYDYRGVLGMGIAPDRDWSSADKWFCYEYAATALKFAGLDVFSSLSHITEVPLLALKTNPAITPVTNS